jgi:hypothetical protein
VLGAAAVHRPDGALPGGAQPLDGGAHAAGAVEGDPQIKEARRDEEGLAGVAPWPGGASQARLPNTTISGLPTLTQTLANAKPLQGIKQEEEEEMLEVFRTRPTQGGELNACLLAQKPVHFRLMGFRVVAVDGRAWR